MTDAAVVRIGPERPGGRQPHGAGGRPRHRPGSGGPRRAAGARLGADVPRSAARRLLGLPPDGCGLTVSPVPRSGEVRARGGRGRRSTSPIRSTTAERGRPVTGHGQTLGQPRPGRRRAWRRLFEPMARDNPRSSVSEVFPPDPARAAPPGRPDPLRAGCALCSGHVDRAAVPRRSRPCALHGRRRPPLRRLDTPLSGFCRPVARRRGAPVRLAGRGGRLERITDAMAALLTEARRGHQDRDQGHQSRPAARPERERPDVVLLDTAPDAATARSWATPLPGRVRRALGRYTRAGGAQGRLRDRRRRAVDQRGLPPSRHGAPRRHGRGDRASEAATSRADARAAVRPAGSAVSRRPIAVLRRHQPAVCLRPRAARLRRRRHRGGVGQIERFAPGFRARIVATRTRGPREMEALQRQLRGRGHHRRHQQRPPGRAAASVRARPVRPRRAGRFLCTSATPPGAGVHGMGGFNAAESALKRLQTGRPA